MRIPGRLTTLLTIRYVFVLGALGLLALISYLVQERVHDAIDSDAAVINAAGAQRMLSQRIALNAELLVEAPGSFRKDHYRKMLMQSIGQMESNYEGLLNGDPERGLPGDPPEKVRGFLFGPEGSVDTQTREFIFKSRQLARTEDKDLHWTNENLLLITKAASGEFLNNLNNIVSAYQLVSEKKIARLATVQLLTAGLTILFLFVSAVAVFRPMVERIKTEMSEQDKIRRRLAGVLDSVHEAIITVSPEGLVESMNRASLSMFGVDEKTVIGSPIGALIIAKDEVGGGILDRQTISREGTAPVHEVKGRRKDGTTFPLELTLSDMIQDGRRMFIIAGRDITERMRSEEDLRLASTVFESGQHGITITDKDAIILKTNTAFTITTGYTKEEVLGKKTSILSSGHHSSEFYIEMWDSLRREGVWEGEVWNKRKNGEIYPEHLEINAVRDEAGNVRNYVAVFTDITRLKSADEELKKYATELQTINVDLRNAVFKANEANRAKSDFLAAMSHELRTPLNAVIGFSEAISLEVFGPVGNSKYLEYLHAIGESAHHLLNVINDILDVSKIEAGSIDLLDEEMSILSTIEATISLIRPRAEKDKIALVVDLPDDTPSLQADNRRVKQMLLNLLSNAVKFTPEAGTITVTVKDEGRKGLSIEIADTGIGIAEEDLAKAMSPFGQVDSSLARRYEGTGLGLPLTKGLIELHGGALEVESVVGKGTKVRVRFPYSRVMQGAGRASLNGESKGLA